MIRIGDNEYVMYQLPPRVSSNLFLDVFRMIGPVVGKLIDTGMNMLAITSLADILDLDLPRNFFTDSLTTASQQLDKAVVNATIDVFREYTEVNGQPLAPVFDAHFLGKIDEMYKWLGWGVGVQWGKLLSASTGSESRGASQTAGPGQV